MWVGKKRLLVCHSLTEKQYFSYLFNISIETSGRVNFILKAGVKLRSKKTEPKKYTADLSVLARKKHESNKENKSVEASAIIVYIILV